MTPTSPAASNSPASTYSPTLRSCALSEKETPAGADAGVSWEGQATSLLVLIEGLANSVETIRATYFRNHEILYPDLADYLDSCRNGIRTVLSLFEAERDGDDSWLVRLGCPPLQADSDVVAADGEHLDLKRIKARISRTGPRTVKDLLLRARFEALVFIGDKRRRQGTPQSGTGRAPLVEAGVSDTDAWSGGLLGETAGRPKLPHAPATPAPVRAGVTWLVVEALGRGHYEGTLDPQFSYCFPHQSSNCRDGYRSHTTVKVSGRYPGGLRTG